MKQMKLTRIVMENDSEDEKEKSEMSIRHDREHRARYEKVR